MIFSIKRTQNVTVRCTEDGGTPKQRRVKGREVRRTAILDCRVDAPSPSLFRCSGKSGDVHSPLFDPYVAQLQPLRSAGKGKEDTLALGN